MSDIVSGEVLSPACRFLPQCEHDEPRIFTYGFEPFGESRVFKLAVDCDVCNMDYRREDSYGVEGLSHGNL